MYTVWTKHLEDLEEKQKFEKYVLGSKRLLNRLKDILQEQEDALDVGETSPKNYDSPSWAYKQAHSNGYRQCLNVIKKLVDLNQQLPTMEDTNERNAAR
jgi:hypothetical protein